MHIKRLEAKSDYARNKAADFHNQISNHLLKLIEEFGGYFLNTMDENIYRLSTDPFNVDIQFLPGPLQEEAAELKHDSAAKYDFEKMDISSFWIKYSKVYKKVSQASLLLYLPFSTTYLCEIIKLNLHIR
uniref:Protein ZBED8 n=1 Tax=Cacopsylla melanoneura TaxID=428564 RepID=A0A8D9ER84_9HEMI